MAAEYRIIKQDDDFIVQKKSFWWWSTMKHLLPCTVPGGLPVASITRFPTLEAARDAIEDLRPKRSSEIQVIETRLIW